MARQTHTKDPSSAVHHARIIFAAFGETYETLNVSSGLTFSEILAHAGTGLEVPNAFLPSQEVKDFVIFAASQRSDQSHLARLAKDGDLATYKDLVPPHSFVLRNITGSSKVHDALRKKAPHVDLRQNFSILIRSKVSVTAEIISELYPNIDSTLRLIRRSEKNWSLKDLEPNLDPTTLTGKTVFKSRVQHQSAVKTSDVGEENLNVIERELFSGDTKHTININVAADATVKHGNRDEEWIHPRHLLVQPLYLQRIIKAANYFKVVNDSKPDNHSMSYLRNLTTRLDRLYERASHYALNPGTISSSSLTVLVVPIFDDVFVDHLGEHEGAYDLELERATLANPEGAPKDTKGSDEHDDSEQGDSEADDEGGGIQEELVSGEEYKTLGDQMYFTFWFSDPTAIDRLWRLNGKPLYNSPRPDRIVLLYGFPFILLEVISDKSKTDEIRGIAQGCSVNRALNIEGITAKGTNDVVTIVVYVDAAMVVTFHFLTSKHVARNVIPPHRIPIQHKKVSFNLAREVARDQNGKVTKVIRRCEAVDMVKFLYDIKGFLHSHYPPESRDRISGIVQEAQDFSLLVRMATDTKSLSKASKLFTQAHGPNSKGRQASGSTPASGSRESGLAGISEAGEERHVRKGSRKGQGSRKVTGK
ncbi:hypothetical protein AAF712_003981 [Marasmius tenuissimus]|uniref:Uncharacterized protein n=1 Tax=Marasmius tenuissimus TaxID=585030 RepID=A0ABR3A7L2_9AGAR